MRNLNRLEFVVTYACTGRCKHCSEGAHDNAGVWLGAELAASAVRDAAGAYAIASVMTFGGEPLLYPETVFAIHEAARAAGVPKRQIITNGFFCAKQAQREETARRLAQCGVNDVLLSVDAFHQETIPLAPVREFAEALLGQGVPLHTHPAWLVGPAHDNPYNRRTNEILAEFQAIGVARSDGNVIHPAGNALLWMRDYFEQDVRSISPYEEDPRDMRAVCVARMAASPAGIFTTPACWTFSTRMCRPGSRRRKRGRREIHAASAVRGERNGWQARACS